MTDLIVYPDHSSHAAFAFVGCSISAIHSQKCEVNGDKRLQQSACLPGREPTGPARWGSAVPFTQCIQLVLVLPVYAVVEPEEKGSVFFSILFL